MTAKSSKRFQILQRLGTGSMGEVFLVKDRQKAKKVALKRLTPGQSLSSLQYFQEEVKLLSQLSHPNLIQIHDYFPNTAEVTEADSKLDLTVDDWRGPCFSMEYVEGQSLDELGQHMNPDQWIDRFVELSQGLDYLHSRHLLHGDLKGANVLVTSQPRAKILDFGLARLAHDPSSGKIQGTLAYLPPEAFWGDYYFFSDLFSLGVIFYEALSGRLPYSKPLTQVDAGLPPPTPLKKLRPELPEFFCELIHRLLELAPQKRPSSAASLIGYLNQHLKKPIQKKLGLVLEKIPWVGRQPEMQQLHDLLGKNDQTPPQLLEITGPTGIGRTRLIEEVKWDWQLKGHGYQAVGPESSLPTAWQKNKQLLVFQDLHHWSKPKLKQLNLLLSLLREQASALTILLEYNSDFSEPTDLLPVRKHWPTPLHTIPLKELSDEESGQLLEQAGLSQNLDPKVQQAILKSAGGRPLLLLEALRQAISGQTKRFSAPSSLTESTARRVQQLSPAAQAFFCRLVVHPEPVALTDARALNLETNFEEIFWELKQKNFLKTQDSQMELNNPSLRPLYQQAFAKTQIKQAHLAWVNYLLKKFGKKPQAIPQAIAIAQHALASGEVKTFKDWTFCATTQLTQLSRDDEAFALLDHYQKICQTPLERSMVQAHLAPYYYRLGRWDKAQQAYERWFADREDDETYLQKLKYHFYLGLVAFSQGDLRKAQEDLDQSLKIGKEKFPPHRPYLARSHLLLGQIQEKHHQLKDAQEHFRQARGLAEQDPLLLGEVEENLGRLSRLRFKFEDAKSHYQNAQTLYHQSQNSQAEALAYHDLGLVLREQGFLSQALKTVDQSLSLSQASGALLQWARYQSNRVLILRDLAQYAEAQAALKQAQAILEVSGSAAQKLILKLQSAELYFWLGNFSRGQEMVSSLLDNPKSLEASKLKLTTQLLMAEGALLQKQWKLAHENFQKVWKASRTNPQLPEAFLAQWGLARLAMAQGKLSTNASVKTLKENLSKREGPSFQADQIVLDFLTQSREARTETSLLNCLNAIKDCESPEQRREYYQAIASSLEQQGLPHLAIRLRQSAAAEFEKIVQSLPEELKMDYEKNRSLNTLEEALGNNHVPTPQADSTPTNRQSQISEMRFRQLTEINRQIGRKKDLTEILERIMDASIELTGAERGFLILKNQDVNTGPMVGFEVKTARHLNQGSLLEQDFQFSMSAVSQAVDTGSFVLTDNAQLDDRFQERQSVMQFQLKSILVVPLEIEGEILGAIYLDHRFEPGCFSEMDVTVLTAFASQGALAIEKAQILEELNQAKSQLEEEVETQARHIEVLTGKLSQVREDLRYEYGEIIGQSAPMMQVFQLLDHVTETTIPVWIWGESGTGKELVARSLHFNSPRKDGPFVSENCSAIPETLLESELFGHKKGAFTHADRDRMGLFEQAHGGTLFLDEVGDMSLGMQAKLLRVLQEGEVRPVGSSQKIKVNVRLVTASHNDLKQMVQEEQFRQDLFYRINGLSIHLPPLRERKEDIPILTQHLIKKAAKEFSLQSSEVTEASLQALLQYGWPGNIRELEAVLRNALLFGKGRPITPELLGLTGSSEEGPRPIIPSSRTSKVEEESQEKQVIISTLKKHHMDKGKVAEELGISLRTLYTRMEKLGVPKKKSVLAKYLGLA